MNNVTTAGIVLSSMPIGEYDRRVEILTADFGRITAFARGARKPGSSLVSCTRAFACGKFELFQGRSAYTMKSGNINEYFDELTTDIEITYYGFYFLELAQYFSRENVEASDMLRLLFYSLKALSLKTIPHRLVKAVYELKMLQINGIAPLPDRIMNERISQGCLRAYDYVFQGRIEKLYTFTLTEEVLSEFERLVRRFIEQNVDKKFKSLPLISDL